MPDHSEPRLSHLLLVNGPNLSRLGTRQPAVYGTTTLVEVEDAVRTNTQAMGATVDCFQSDVEGEIIGFIDRHRSADAIVLNPGALMMSGWCLRDCLEDFAGVKIEVHLSHVFAREDFRRTSVIADVMDGFLCGLGVDGYLLAVDAAARLRTRQVETR